MLPRIFDGSFVLPSRQATYLRQAILVGCLGLGFLLSVEWSEGQGQSPGSSEPASLEGQLAGLTANSVQATDKVNEAKQQLAATKAELRQALEPPRPGASAQEISQRSTQIAELRAREQQQTVQWGRAEIQRQQRASAVAEFVRTNPTVTLPASPPPTMPNIDLSRARETLERLKKGGINFDGSRDRPGLVDPVRPTGEFDPLPRTPGAANIGPYSRQAEQQQQAIPANTPPAERMQRLQQVSPFRSGVGGVALGSAPKRAPTPTSADFVVDKGRVYIEVGIQGEAGKVVFADVTMTELWAAYHFLRPNSEQQRLGAKPGVLGLVGIAKNNMQIDGSWDFGVHPAIANTVLASDAMRLDMVLTIGDPRLPRMAGGWATYLWYDEPAVITARDGKIGLKAATAPEHTLMRVKLWGQEKAIPFDMNPIVEKLFEKFDGLRSMDRFARIIAVLNWLDGAGKLPSLPAVVQPLQFDLPSKCFLRDVSYEGTTILHGHLSKSDPLDPVLQGRHHKTHKVSMTRGKHYRVDLESGKFDTYLRIEDASGRNLAQDDDSGGNLNARIVFRPSETGEYRIAATSFQQGATGPYFLKIWEMPTGGK